MKAILFSIVAVILSVIALTISLHDRADYKYGSILPKYVAEPSRDSVYAVPNRKGMRFLSSSAQLRSRGDSIYPAYVVRKKHKPVIERLTDTAAIRALHRLRPFRWPQDIQHLIYMYQKDSSTTMMFFSDGRDPVMINGTVDYWERKIDKYIESLKH